MNHLLQRLWREETGQDLAEYALLLALIVLGAISSMGTLAQAINNIFSNTATSLGNAGAP